MDTAMSTASIDGKATFISACQLALATAGYTFCWLHNVTGMVLSLVAATAVATAKE
jgi:hypothetical protein